MPTPSSRMTGERSKGTPLDRILSGMSVEFREEPCRSALNRVQGMPFKWSLNPYMGCAHRCTFCYVRGFERRAERPSGEAYGRSVRVKINVAEVLRRELARTSWKRELVAIGAATDPYQPAEGRYRLTRACLLAFADARSPLSLITRGPMNVRDLHALRRGAPSPERATTEPIKSAVAALKKRFDVADRRARPLEPRPGAEQLALAI